MLLQAKIKMLRHAGGQNQKDVARLMGISVPAYSKMETGVTDMNYSRLEQLAALHQLTVAQLLDPDHDPFKKDDALLLRALSESLVKKEQQISALQSKLIGLYEKLGVGTQKKTA